MTTSGRRFLSLALPVCFAMLSLPDSASAQHKRWYLAEGATTAFFEEEILIANPNASAAAVAITFSRFDGSTVPHQLVVPATSRMTLRVNDIVPDTAVSAVIDSSLDIIVERSMYFPGTARRDGHNVVGVTAPALVWRLAEGSTHFFNPFVLIANPSRTSTALVRVTFLRTDGGRPIKKIYTVKKSSRFTVWVNAMVPELGAAPFSTMVESLNGVEIIVERAMYWNGLDGGHASVGVEALSTTWHFAEGFTGADFDTFLLIGNPDPANAARVEVTFFLEAGAPIVRTHTIAPENRFDLWVDQVPGLESAAFSIRVQSQNGVPTVAERSMYWNNFVAGHVTTGLRAVATRWGFAEGLEGSHYGTTFRSFFLLANSSDTAAEIRVTFYREDGTGIARTLALPPNARFTLPTSWHPDLRDEKFATFFEATNGVPFIAERTVYWDDTFYGGHASHGTPWPAGAIVPPRPPGTPPPTSPPPGPPPGPPLPPPTTRTGTVTLQGHAFADDGGVWNAVGATLFPMFWAWRSDRQWLDASAQWLVDHGVDYVRVLAMVGAQPFWAGREIDPFASDYWAVVDQATQHLYETYGLRTEATLFADAQVMMPRPADRMAFVDAWAAFVNQHPERFQHLEVANEYWQNGIVDITELRQLAERLAARTSVLVSASSTFGADCAAWTAVYGGLAADLATLHLDRDDSAVEGAWRPVRQAWHPRGCDAIPAGWTNNEPIGPGSSVVSDDDPLRIVMAAVVTFISQGTGYVYHSRPGIRADEHLGDVPNAQAIGDGLRAIRSYLPADLPNWTRQNHYWAGHPFAPSLDNQMWVDGHATGAVRAFAATRDSRFVVAPIGIRGHLDLTASRALEFDVIHPLTGAVIASSVTLAAGETYRLGDTPEAVVLVGLFR